MLTGAVILSLLLGSAVTGPLTALQIAALAGIGIKAVPQAIGVIKFLQTPAVRKQAAANGDTAIRLQPGASSER